ncbi:Uncharacterized ABC transporter ATP-binding protein MJ0412 [Geodia barretti]|uniref:Uncharacterized ABC transporter ATP-binding protein MJ0412 n=1 Tax=Geodia barretti TaxID=519541 RepID=A0AA35R6Q9_GEOBA|nr:Uncharacterized ABC transporter ATP-binding protein MJ0412 [Geodia barretti]
MSRLEVKNLTQTFNQKNTALRVLDGLNFSVDDGQFVALLGPSGCGKSTLFNIVSGLLVPDTGEIYLNDERIYGNTGDFAYMQQKDLLLPWRTVLRNVLIGLSGFENSYPMQLSGGMRQRVALVRTLLFRKEILLLDEPFGALDAMTRTVMQSILLDIWSENRQTVLLITHDVEEALLLADKIYVLTARPATLKAEVPVPLPRPRNITDTSLIRLKKELLTLLQVEMSKVFDAG